VISDFGAACQYLTMVVNCSVEGEGIGALRTLSSADSSTIVERLETLDGAAHRLSYTLLTDTPFRDCVTTMAVRDLGPPWPSWCGRRASSPTGFRQVKPWRCWRARWRKTALH
jgi:hypothetical protein